MDQTTNYQTIAGAIVEAIGTPILVLDQDLRVISTNRSFCEAFDLTQDEIEGQAVYELGAREWDISELLAQLRLVIAEHLPFKSYEVEAVFAGFPRTLLVDACEMPLGSHAYPVMLVSLNDVTVARRAALDMRQLVELQDLLLEEMSHRTANSLMIVFSILMLGAERTQHTETRQSLQDACRRIASVAMVHRQLKILEDGERVNLNIYLSALCEHLSVGIVRDHSKISLRVRVAEDEVDSILAVQLGLIVTELVINALKHAFPNEGDGGEITIAYDVTAGGWILSVSDTGVGGVVETKTGLGTVIIDALVRQLDAKAEILVGWRGGRSISIIHLNVSPRDAASETALPQFAA